MDRMHCLHRAVCQRISFYYDCLNLIRLKTLIYNCRNCICWNCVRWWRRWSVCRTMRNRAIFATMRLDAGRFSCVLWFYFWFYRRYRCSGWCWATIIDVHSSPSCQCVELKRRPVLMWIHYWLPMHWSLFYVWSTIRCSNCRWWWRWLLGCKPCRWAMQHRKSYYYAVNSVELATISHTHEPVNL